MKVQVVVIVHVCREQNFKSFEVIESGGEKSRKALQVALQRIFDAKVDKAKKAKEGAVDDGEECPKPNITFQTVCYE